MPTPVIPESITVHLGAPDSAAQNVTVTFPEYIKNVASSEIFPTWPDSAIRANIYAQISFALNRIFTEYYPSRGYAFDITNDISRDQSFVYGREVFDNISRTVDEIFNSYIRRVGAIEPLFAVYCDGIEVADCGGLTQWGTVELAEQGLTPLEILQEFYGDDIELVTGVPVEGIELSVPDAPLGLGSSGIEVQQVQRRLNRISTNYPAIPKIYPTDGVFGQSTERAVRAFQEVFDLTPDGIVGNATWYKIQRIFTSVKRLTELNSEGLQFSEVSTHYPSELREGDTGVGVRVVQYYLKYVANFVGTVQTVGVDGDFGPATTASLRSFQRTYGLPETGVVDLLTYNTLYNVYTGLTESLDLTFRPGVIVPFPGIILNLGAEGEDVELLQSYLNYIARTYTNIPTVPVTGYFGNQTEAAVNAFQTEFGLTGNPNVVNAAVWDAITSVYEDLYIGNLASEGQYPGYDVGGTA